MNERAKEVAEKIVAEMFRRSYYSQEVQAESVCSILSNIPEFQPPQWIKCSERMPTQKEVYWLVLGVVVEDGIYVDDPRCICATHWMPRFVPAPPVIESEVVIGLRKAREHLIEKTSCKQEIFDAIDAAISELKKK